MSDEQFPDPFADQTNVAPDSGEQAPQESDAGSGKRRTRTPRGSEARKVAQRTIDLMGTKPEFRAELAELVGANPDDLPGLVAALVDSGSSVSKPIALIAQMHTLDAMDLVVETIGLAEKPDLFRSVWRLVSTVGSNDLAPRPPAAPVRAGSDLAKAIKSMSRSSVEKLTAKAEWLG